MRSQRTQIMFKLATILLIGSGAAIYLNTQVLKDDQAVEFISRVSLETNCELDLNSFALKNLTTGKNAPFKHGEAFIRATRDHKLKVIMAPKYSLVSVDSEEFLAEPKLDVFQDCSKEVTLSNIFDSMNSQFGQKE